MSDLLKLMAKGAFNPISTQEKIERGVDVKELHKEHLFDASKVAASVAIDINSCNGLEYRIKEAKKEIDAADSITVELTKAFIESTKRMSDSTELLKAKSKSVSSNVRQVAADLQSALNKVEKQANFDRLERYVDLLERAAKAMTILSDIEKTGKLSKISDALR